MEILQFYDGKSSVFISQADPLTHLFLYSVSSCNETLSVLKNQSYHSHLAVLP